MKIIYYPGASTIYDSDAADYISRVNTVDAANGATGGLEVELQNIIHDLFINLKTSDSPIAGVKNYAALKGTNIMAGPKTRQGCYVPLIASMPVPTEFGAAGGWNYSRKQGLAGNGTNNYLNTNRTANADPRDNFHMSVYKTTTGNSGCYIGNLTPYHDYIDYAGSFRFTSRNITATASNPLGQTGFLGHSRSASNEFSYRINGITTVNIAGTGSIGTANILVFNRTGGDYFSSARLAYYSLGESIAQGSVDSIITGYMNSLAALTL